MNIKKYVSMGGIGLIWLRMGIIGKTLLMRHWTFVFHKLWKKKRWVHVLLCGCINKENSNKIYVRGKLIMRMNTHYWRQCEASLDVHLSCETVCWKAENNTNWLNAPGSIHSSWKSESYISTNWCMLTSVIYIWKPDNKHLKEDPCIGGRKHGHFAISREDQHQYLINTGFTCFFFFTRFGDWILFCLFCTSIAMFLM